MSISIDALYEAFIDEEMDFGEDVFHWFAPEDYEGMSPGAWVQEWGMYLPTYDPTAEHFAFQEKALAYRDAGEVYNLAKDIQDRVYDTAVEDSRDKLEKEIAQGKRLEGDIGLRSGGVQKALEDSTRKAHNRVTNLKDSLELSKEDSLNSYNKKIVEATLAEDQAIHENKEEFYERTMAMVAKLTGMGAFQDEPCPSTGLPPAIICPESSENPGATVCNEDECNLYTGMTPGGEAGMEGDVIASCVSQGYSLEQCQEVGGDFSLILDAVHGTGTDPESQGDFFDLACQYLGWWC